MKKVKILFMLLVFFQSIYAQKFPIKKDSISIRNNKINTKVSCDCGEKFNSLPNQFEVKMNYPAYNYGYPTRNIICLKQLCINPLELEVPNDGINNCITYEWYIKSNKIPTAQDPLNYYRSITMTGQGSPKVSINCNDIKEMRSHSGAVQIKCNGKVKTGIVVDFAVQDCPITN
jgi:hypothetical protein